MASKVAAAISTTKYHVGMSITASATTWSEKWAKQEYGANWNTARLEGVIVGFKPGGLGKRAKSLPKWLIKFPDDAKIYEWTEMMLDQYDEPTPGEVDLITPVKGGASSRKAQTTPVSWQAADVLASLRAGPSTAVPSPGQDGFVEDNDLDDDQDDDVDESFESNFEDSETESDEELASQPIIWKKRAVNAKGKGKEKVVFEGRGNPGRLFRMKRGRGLKRRPGSLRMSLTPLQAERMRSTVMTKRLCRRVLFLQKKGRLGEVRRFWSGKFLEKGKFMRTCSRPYSTQ